MKKLMIHILTFIVIFYFMCKTGEALRLSAGADFRVKTLNIQTGFSRAFANPAYARNKNVLLIGGSGSGKTRFFVKPNLMQMHSALISAQIQKARF